MRYYISAELNLKYFYPREYGVMVQLHPAMNPVFLPNSQLDHRQVSQLCIYMYIYQGPVVQN